MDNIGLCAIIKECGYELIQHTHSSPDLEPTDQPASVLGTLLVPYAVYSEIWSLHLIHLWGAVGSHSEAPGEQLQIFSLHLGQGYWLEIDLTYMLLMVGETGAPGGNPRQHGEIT